MIPAFGMVIFWSCILSVGTSQVGHDDSVNRDESLVVMVLTPGGGLSRLVRALSARSMRQQLDGQD